MVYISCITLLLLSKVVLADYYIDNANASIIYSMPPSQSGQSWKTFAVDTQYQELQLTNSTGNYTILLDASSCYDQNYAQVGCGTSDNCFVQIPFTGSGITVYVFNAGLSGMTASFSVDGGAAVSSSIAAPTVAENYQVSNVSLHGVQGLQTGNHTIKMTLMDWDGSGTVMKFDYAHVNETFVAAPVLTTTSSTSITTSSQPFTSMIVTTLLSSSQTPTQTMVPTASALNRVGVGGIVGIALGGAAVLGGIVIGILWLRKRRTLHKGSSSSASNSTFQIEPFTSEHLSSVTPSSRSQTRHHSFPSLQSFEHSAVPPLIRSAILRDAHAAGASSPLVPIQRRSTASGATPCISRPLLRQPSDSADNDSFVSLSISISHATDERLSTFLDPVISARFNLTQAQIETVRGLLAERVHADTITSVIEAFGSSRASTDETDIGQNTHSHTWSLDSPPSYKTRDRR